MKIKNRITVFIMCILLCFTNLAYGNEIQYTDVVENDWYYNQIMQLSDLNIITGYKNGEFRPNNNIKANEFIKLILLAIGEEVNIDSTEQWDKAYIRHAEKLGIVNKNFITLEKGSRYGSNCFTERFYYGNVKYTVEQTNIIENYNNYITREQVAAIISNILAYKNVDSLKEACDFCIDLCNLCHKTYPSFIQDKKMAVSILNTYSKHIYYNILINEEWNEFSIEKIKYTLENNLSLFSNNIDDENYSKEDYFINISSIDYDYTYRYIPTLLNDFYDIKDKYKYDVMQLYRSGIMQGSANNNFNPNKFITRAEVSTVILRLMFKEKRLPYLIDNMKIYKGNIDGKEHSLLAPILNGKPVNEMVELCNLLDKCYDNTLGVEDIEMTNHSYKFTGYENEHTYHEYNDIFNDIENFDAEDMNLANQNSLYKNVEFEVDFSQYNHWSKPYRLDIEKDWNFIEDSDYQGIVIKEENNRVIKDYPNSYDKFLMKYHEGTLKCIFKFLFEDEFDEAWKTLIDVLKIYDNSIISNHPARIDKVLNNRLLTIIYDEGSGLGYIGICVTLKLYDK